MNDGLLFFFPKLVVPSKGLFWPKDEIKHKISSLLILWSCIIKIHFQWPSWRLGNWFAFNFYLIWELFMLRRTQFSNFAQHTAKLHSSCFVPTPFSVRSACFSFQGYVFEHISPNVKLISDNKFQSSGISFYKVQPVRRENDVFVQCS